MLYIFLIGIFPVYNLLYFNYNATIYLIPPIVFYIANIFQITR